MESFGDWLQEQLDEKGWTQTELARRAHMGNATVNRIINGTRNVGPDVASKIARVLKEPPETVFRMAGLLPPTARGNLSASAKDDLDQIHRYVAMLSPEAQARLTEQLVGIARTMVDLSSGGTADVDAA